MNENRRYGRMLAALLGGVALFAGLAYVVPRYGSPWVHAIAHAEQGDTRTEGVACAVREGSLFNAYVKESGGPGHDVLRPVTLCGGRTYAEHTRIHVEPALGAGHGYAVCKWVEMSGTARDYYALDIHVHAMSDMDGCQGQ